MVYSDRPTFDFRLAGEWIDMWKGGDLAFHAGPLCNKDDTSISFLINRHVYIHLGGVANNVGNF